jgi:type I restriction enzyme S subunit
LIRTPNVGKGRLNLSGVHRVSRQVYDQRNERAIPQENDLILAREAPVGNVAIIKKEQKVCLGQRTVLIRPNPQIVSPDFLVYYLLSPKMQNTLVNSANGATVSHLNMSSIRSLEINLPPLDVQKKRAAILSVIDDKIELNNTINENLEQQAQAIYRSMFVSAHHNTDRIGLLSELITVKYGKDHKKLNDGIIPVYGSGGIMRYVEKFLYDKESVLIPRKGSLNNVMYVDEPFWSVDTMFFTEMKMPNVAKFVFHFLKSKDLASLNAGSAVPSMTTDILNSMQIRIPSAERLAEFETLVAPLYKAIKDNIRQSERLSTLRDTLLPKLMNGEIDVSNVRI